MSGLFEQYDNLLPAEIQEKTSESLDWFRQNLRKITLREDQVSRSQGETASPSNMRTGEMFMYMYDAKYKDLLPWYDRFPLMILLEKSPKGFLGLNLHYIAPRYRAVLLEELYKYSTDEDLEEGVKDSFYEIAILFCNYIWNNNIIIFNENLFTEYYNLFINTMNNLSNDHVAISTRRMPVSSRTRSSRNENKCGICLENYEDLNTQMVQLECGHIFHEECISNWLTSNQEQSFNCPLCRKNILKEIIF